MLFKAAIFLFFSFSASVAAFGAETRFLTHSLEDAAFTDDTGALRGHLHSGRRAFYVEVVYAMMQARDLKAPIEEVSLSRGFRLIGSEERYAFFNVIRSESRQANYKWVGPIDVFPTYFYELKTAPTMIKSVEDAKKVGSICAINGNNLVALLELKGFRNVLKANSDDACAKLLQYGRVNLITASEYPWFANDQALAGVLTRTPVTLSVDEGYIAFSLSHSDEDIRAWQAALDGLKREGIYERLRVVYLRPHVSKSEFMHP